MNLYGSMKRVLFLLLALISLNVMAQEKPIQCDSVIQAEGKNVSVLYPQIRAWAAMTFNSAQDVIQMRLDFLYYFRHESFISLLDINC